MRLLSVFLFTISFAIAAPISDLTTVNDGLDFENPDNISDDYIRLTLLTPSYQTANQIKQAVENWLGPDLVRIESNELILIQAPRDSSARIEFIAALLALDVAE
jgi:flagellar basal body P-ring protein FlgI